MEIGNYTKIGFQNGGGPPVNAENLNKMDTQIDLLDKFQGNFFEEIQAVADDLHLHETDTSNPHAVTATQVGLGSIVQDLIDHENDTTNPHSVTATQVGLGTITQDLADHKARTDNPHVVTPKQLGLADPEIQRSARHMAGRQALRTRYTFANARVNEAFIVRNAEIGVYVNHIPSSVNPQEYNPKFVLLGPAFQRATAPDEVSILWTENGETWNTAEMFPEHGIHDPFNSNRWTDACVGKPPGVFFSDASIYAIAGWRWDDTNVQWIPRANHIVKIAVNPNGTFSAITSRIVESDLDIHKHLWTSITYSDSLDRYVIAGDRMIGYSNDGTTYTISSMANGTNQPDPATVRWIPEKELFFCTMGRNIHTSTDGITWALLGTLPVSVTRIKTFSWSAELDEFLIVPGSNGASLVFKTNGVWSPTQYTLIGGSSDREWKDVIWIPECSMYVAEFSHSDPDDSLAPYPVLATSLNGITWRPLGTRAADEKYANKIYWVPYFDSMMITLAESGASNNLPVIRVGSTTGGDIW